MGAPATISHGGLRDRRQPGDFRTRSDKRDGDSSPMAAAEAPELRDRGDRGSGDLSRAAPIPGCAQISGGPARNRVVFIIGRRLKGVVYPSRETATGSAKHKARSAKSGSQARTPSFAHAPPKLMKTTRFLAGPPLKMHPRERGATSVAAAVADARRSHHPDEAAKAHLNNSSWLPVRSKKATLSFDDQITSQSPEFATWHSLLPAQLPESRCILCRRLRISRVIGRKVCLQLNPNRIGTGRHCANRSS